jgi:hypothetical protein
LNAGFCHASSHGLPPGTCFGSPLGLEDAAAAMLILSRFWFTRRVHAAQHCEELALFFAVSGLCHHGGIIL